jgi:two-component sensor histidine kinase
LRFIGSAVDPSVRRATASQPFLHWRAMAHLNASLLRQSLLAWLDWDRRGKFGPRWLAWLWTLLFCVVIALLFTVLGLTVLGQASAWSDSSLWLHWTGRNLVVSLTIGILTHLLFDVLHATWVPPGRVREWPMWLRSVVFTGVPMAGVVIGWPLANWLAGMDDYFGDLMRNHGLSALVGPLLLSLVISVVLHHWFSARAREADALRRATEAQLRLLQGQVEPHFLFNTLATVQALMDTDVPRARRTLDSFTEYLRASLGSLRRDQGTLGDELDLVDAYLHLMQMRMEDRLRYEVRADVALRDAPLPPLALQPLVENAIHHGLEPKREGGMVRVTARRDGDVLVVDVQDDGLGLAMPPRRRKGNGVALANLRERLAGLYGDRAVLDLAGDETGTRATLRLPLAGTTA